MRKRVAGEQSIAYCKTKGFSHLTIIVLCSYIPENARVLNVSQPQLKLTCTVRSPWTLTLCPHRASDLLQI